MGRITLRCSISKHLAITAPDFTTETVQHSTPRKGVTRRDLVLEEGLARKNHGRRTQPSASQRRWLLAFRRTVTAAAGTEQWQSLAPGPISSFDPPFELSVFLFIHIVG